MASDRVLAPFLWWLGGVVVSSDVNKDLGLKAKAKAKELSHKATGRSNH